MPDERVAASLRLARAFLGLQAVAGAAWWIAVFSSDDVRRWTLGGLSPGALVVPDVLLLVGASAAAAIVGGRVFAVVVAGWTSLVTVGLIVYATVEREAGWGAVAMVLAAIGSIGAALTLWFGRLPSHWIVIGPFAFRAAKQRARSRHLVHSLAQLVLFWTTFLVVLPLLFGWIEHRWRIEWRTLADDPPVVAGIVTFVLGSCFGLWSCLSMALIGNGTPLPSAMANRLVVVGPYRIVRNPMAVAGALQTIGVGLWIGSWAVMATAVAGGVLWNQLIRPEEEADLASRFGDDYDRYRAGVRCWLPRLRRPTLRG